jgi:hypothetical protein
MEIKIRINAEYSSYMVIERTIKNVPDELTDEEISDYIENNDLHCSDMEDDDITDVIIVDNGSCEDDYEIIGKLYEHKLIPPTDEQEPRK